MIASGLALLLVAAWLHGRKSVPTEWRTSAVAWLTMGGAVLVIAAIVKVFL